MPMKICSRCGTANPDGNDSCTACGAVFPTQDLREPERNEDVAELQVKLETLQHELQSRDEQLDAFRQAVKTKDDALAGLEVQLATAVKALAEVRDAKVNSPELGQAETALKKEAEIAGDNLGPAGRATEPRNTFVEEIKEKFEDVVHGKDQDSEKQGKTEPVVKEAPCEEEASNLVKKTAGARPSFLEGIKDKIEDEIEALREKNKEHDDTGETDPSLKTVPLTGEQTADAAGETLRTNASATDALKDESGATTNQQGGQARAASALAIEAYPLKKTGFRIEMKAGDKTLDLSGTAFKIRATLERTAEAIVLVVQPGATVKVRMSEKQKWERLTGGNRMTAAEGLILFDPSAATTARLQNGQ